jgi:SAM-dependent methyltransferase
MGALTPRTFQPSWQNSSLVSPRVTLERGCWTLALEIMALRRLREHTARTSLCTASTYQRPPPAGTLRVALARMDANRLAFANDAFDAAVSVNGIEYAMPDRALPELRRVLRPGAEAAFVLHRPDSFVVQRAVAINRFVREARLLEVVALAQVQLATPNDRLRTQIEGHLRGIERDRGSHPPDPFFPRLWEMLQATLRASHEAREMTSKTMKWCDGFLRWVLRKNDYVAGHAAQLGKDEQSLANTLTTHGLRVASLATLRSDAGTGPGIAGWAVVVRKD